MACRWWAVATPRPPCASWASPRARSGTSPPVVGPAWSTSRARTCPASTYSTTERRDMPKRSRTPLMAGNWKMNLNHQEAVVLVQKLAWTLSDKKHDYGQVEVVVVPPYTDIRSVQTMVDGDRLQIKYGAQDVSQHDDGAYTGDISAAMLEKLGCSFAVVGHSERREHHAEDDGLV